VHFIAVSFQLSAVSNRKTVSSWKLKKLSAISRQLSAKTQNSQFLKMCPSKLETLFLCADKKSFKLEVEKFQVTRPLRGDSELRYFATL